MERALQGLFRAKVPTGNTAQWYSALHRTEAHSLDVFQYLHRMSRNPEMTMLDLSGIRVTEEEIVAIRLLLLSHPALKEINITDTRFALGCERFLADAIEKNTRICHITISPGTVFESDTNVTHVKEQITNLVKHNYDMQKAEDELRRQRKEKRASRRETSRLYEGIGKVIDQQTESRLAIWSEWFSGYHELLTEFEQGTELQIRAQRKRQLRRLRDKERKDFEESEETARSGIVEQECDKLLRSVGNMWLSLRDICFEEQAAERFVIKGHYREGWTFARRAEKARWALEAGARCALCEEESVARITLEQTEASAIAAFMKHCSACYEEARVRVLDRLTHEEDERQRKLRELQIMQEQLERRKQREEAREAAREYERTINRDKLLSSEVAARKAFEKEFLAEKHCLIHCLHDTAKLLFRVRSITNLQQQLAELSNSPYILILVNPLADDPVFYPLNPTGNDAGMIFTKVDLFLSRDHIVAKAAKILQKIRDEQSVLETMHDNYLAHFVTDWQILAKSDSDPRKRLPKIEVNLWSTEYGKMENVVASWGIATIARVKICCAIHEPQSGDALCVQEVPVGSGRIEFEITEGISVTDLRDIIRRIWFSSNIYDKAQGRRVDLTLCAHLTSGHVVQAATSVHVAMVHPYFGVTLLPEVVFSSGTRPECCILFPESFYVKPPSRVVFNKEGGTLSVDEDPTGNYAGGSLTFLFTLPPEATQRLNNMIILLEGDANEKVDEDSSFAVFQFAGEDRTLLCFNGKPFAKVEGVLSTEEYAKQKDALTLLDELSDLNNMSMALDGTTTIIKQLNCLIPVAKLHFLPDATFLTADILTKLATRLRYVCHGTELECGRRELQMRLRCNQMGDGGQGVSVIIEVSGEDQSTTLTLLLHTLLYRHPLYLKPTDTYDGIQRAMPIAKDALVEDVDTDKFCGGYLKVSLKNAVKGDNLTFAENDDDGDDEHSLIRIKGTDLIFEGVVIGEVVCGHGIGYPSRVAEPVGQSVAGGRRNTSVAGTPLSDPSDVIFIHFEFDKMGAASVRSVQALLRLIEFVNLSPFCEVHTVTATIEILIGPSEGQSDSTGTHLFDKVEINVMDKPLISFADGMQSEMIYKESGGRVSLPSLNLMDDDVDSFRGGKLVVSILKCPNSCDSFDFAPHKDAPELSFRAEESSDEKMMGTIIVTEGSTEKCIGKYQRGRSKLVCDFVKNGKLPKKYVSALLLCIVYENTEKKPIDLTKSILVTLMDKNPCPTHALIHLKILLRCECFQFVNMCPSAMYTDSLLSLLELKAYPILPYGSAWLESLPNNNPNLEVSELSIEILRFSPFFGSNRRASYTPRKILNRPSEFRARPDLLGLLTMSQQEMVKEAKGTLCCGRDFTCANKLPHVEFFVDMDRNADRTSGNISMSRDRKKEVIGVFERPPDNRTFRIKFADDSKTEEKRKKNADSEPKGVSLEIANWVLNCITLTPENKLYGTRHIGIRIKDIKGRETNCRMAIHVRPCVFNWYASEGTKSPNAQQVQPQPQKLVCAVGQTVLPFANALVRFGPSVEDNGNRDSVGLLVITVSDNAQVEFGNLAVPEVPLESSRWDDDYEGDYEGYTSETLETHPETSITRSSSLLNKTTQNPNLPRTQSNLDDTNRRRGSSTVMSLHVPTRIITSSPRSPPLSPASATRYEPSLVPWGTLIPEETSPQKLTMKGPCMDVKSRAATARIASVVVTRLKPGIITIKAMFFETVTIKDGASLIMKIL